MYFPTGQAKGVMIIVFQQKVIEDVKYRQSLIIRLGFVSWLIIMQSLQGNTYHNK